MSPTPRPQPSDEHVRPAHPWWRRWLRAYRVWRGGVPSKTHAVHFVQRGGQACKRVRFASQDEAQAVVQALRELSNVSSASSSCVPALIDHNEDTVWVAFVTEDDRAQTKDIDFDQAVLGFFARLYATTPRQAQDPAPMLDALEKDLRRLVEAKQLSIKESAALQALAEQLRPERLYCGIDYVDAIRGNFVLSQGQAIGIDIEAFALNEALGTGLAKAQLRWLNAPLCELLSTSDLAQQYPFVRLCFIARYCREKLDQRKPGHLRIQALRDLLVGAD